MIEKRGKFIVIDGTDGSGKATQTELLINRMKQEGRAVQTVSFPRYGKKSCGPVEEYLSGKYGTATEVSAKAASILYAVDRFDASFDIREALEQGICIVADRYVGSNLGHQGSKIHNIKDRHAFYDWNRDLEFNTFGIPVPDINIVLHLPTEISIKLAHDRGGWKADIKTDIHETDHEHLKNAERTYMELTERFEEFTRIECTQNGKLMTPAEIHAHVWNIVQTILK